MLPVILVVAGAAVGAGARYLVDGAIQARTGRAFPWGTLAVNVVGCFVLGAITGRVGPQWQLLLGTGFCGALTTYSTFALDTVTLLADRPLRYAVLNVLTQVTAGVLAAVAGAVLGGLVG